MTRILYYDCFSGISGDMNLAAMIDLGIDPQMVKQELSKLGIDDAFDLRVSRESRHGIQGTRVDVDLISANGERVQYGHDHPYSHFDSHSHSHSYSHSHSHSRSTSHTHFHSSSRSDEDDHKLDAADNHHVHRNLRDIEDLINDSQLDGAVKETALTIFRKVAEAEAKVHGKELYEVHFHEVGAVDSIVDIVGAAICFHALNVEGVWCSSVELGGGTVSCAHGIMPVPAPATVEILKGIPTTRGAVKKETTTPTGAAIIAALADRFTDAPKFILEKSAYGVGHRETQEIPNLLRVHLATVDDDPMPKSGPEAEERTISARLLQCNIDDMTAEMLGVVMETLMENGAMDFHFTPIVMKKNRPATQISLLCADEDEEKFKYLLFRHTTTLGIKSFPIEKTELGVFFEMLETPLGSVTMKHAIMDGKVVRSKPELEDCKALSKRHGIPLGEVYLEIGKHRHH